jgi:hypothetical protein
VYAEPDDSPLTRIADALEDGRIDAARRSLDRLLGEDGEGGAPDSRGSVLVVAAEAALFANDPRAAAQYLDEAVGFALTEADVDRIGALHATLQRLAEDDEFRLSFWDVVVHSARGAEPAYRARTLADAGAATDDPRHFEALLALASEFEEKRRDASWLVWIDWAGHVTQALMNLGRIHESVAMQQQIVRAVTRESPADAGMIGAAESLLAGLEQMAALMPTPEDDQARGAPPL